ncbi:exported hypothetical protein [Cupriavidus taiwanensis]|nr:exported hypothetical protein [Cupriavidus taiwanensis]
MPRTRRNLSERSKFRHPQSSATLGIAASRAALSARHARPRSIPDGGDKWQTCKTLRCPEGARRTHR